MRDWGEKGEQAEWIYSVRTCLFCDRGDSFLHDCRWPGNGKGAGGDSCGEKGGRSGGKSEKKRREEQREKKAGGAEEETGLVGAAGSPGSTTEVNDNEKVIYLTFDDGPLCQYRRDS